MRSATSAPVSISGASNVAGIEADARLLTSSKGTSVLEVTVTTHVRQLRRSCPDAQNCPEKQVFLVRSSVLVDYRFSVSADEGELVVDNEVDATSSVAQVLSMESIGPGDHCVAVFSQILQVDDGTVVGREGLIGTYQQLALASGGSQPSSTMTYCSTDGLTVADGTFVPSNGLGCGGLPNGITTDLTGSKLPDEELMVQVPTCPQDLVTVILRNGEIIPEDTRLVAGQDRAGFFAFVVPRVVGPWRVATVPVDRFRGTVPDDSAYWDVVISPPRES